MAHIHFDYSKVAPFVNEHELGYMQSQVTAADKLLREGTGAGSDFRGWIDLPTNYDKEEFARIKAAAKKIQSDSEVLVVIGIGGSYLGARACRFLTTYLLQLVGKRQTPNTTNFLRWKLNQLNLSC